MLQEISENRTEQEISEPVSAANQLKLTAPELQKTENKGSFRYSTDTDSGAAEKIFPTENPLSQSVFSERFFSDSELKKMKQRIRKFSFRFFEKFFTPKVFSISSVVFFSRS